MSVVYGSPLLGFLGNTTDEDNLLSAIKLTEEQLSNHYGKNWAIQGVPKNIVLRLQTESTEQNYNNADSGLDVPDVEPWDCVTLDDIQNISTYGSNWQNIFESCLRRNDQYTIATNRLHCS